MDVIRITDLEVHYRVGVPDEERSTPQRLLLCIEMEHDFAAAIAGDDLAQTINYFAVTQRLLRLGDNREWRLIEALASDIATLILTQFHPSRVTVEVKKFIIPEAAHVSVRLTRSRGD